MSVDSTGDGQAGNRGNDKEQTTIHSTKRGRHSGRDSKKNSYSDHGMTWDKSGKNGLYAKLGYERP